MRRLAFAAVLLLLAPSLMGEPPAEEDWDHWQVAAGGDWRLEYNLSWDYGLLLAAAEHPALPSPLGAAMPWMQGRTTDNWTIQYWLERDKANNTAARMLMGANASTANRGGYGFVGSSGYNNSNPRYPDYNYSRSISYSVSANAAGIQLWQQKVVSVNSWDENGTVVEEPRSWLRADYSFTSGGELHAAASFWCACNPALATATAVTTLPLRLALPPGQPWLNSSEGWQPLEREGNATIPAGGVAGLLAQSGGNIVVESDREVQAYWMRDRDGEWLGPPEGDYYWPPWLDNESLAGGPLALWLLASFNYTDDWEPMGDGLWRIAFNITLRGGLPDLELTVGELPQPLWEEWPATVDVTVANTGAVASPATLLAADWGGNSSQLPVPPLEPGASHVLAVEFAPLLAHPWLNLTVDPGNAILERDEANNRASVALPVRERLPDFAIALSVSHRAVLEGQPLEATVVVSNIGNWDGKPDTWVTLAVDGAVVTGWNASLGAGESESFSHALEFGPGEHTLRAVADAGNWFREFDEENNVAELEVVVIASGSGVPSFGGGVLKMFLAAIVAAVAGHRKHLAQ